MPKRVMMKKTRQNNRSRSQDSSIFSGVMLANFVLLFHVALIIGVAFIAFFSGGLFTYLPWILSIGVGLIVGSAYLFWRRLKKQGKNLKDILKDPSFQNRTVEVNVLGGLASLRLGHIQEPLAIPHQNCNSPMQLEAPSADSEEQLKDLALLLKQDLITFDQYLQGKQQVTGY